MRNKSGRYRKSFTALVAIACLIPWQGTALANKSQLIQQLTQTVKEFVVHSASPGQRVQVEMGRLDPRLRLNPCSLPLEAFESGTRRRAGRTTIGVRCAGEKPWKLYVPVTVRQFAKAVVTRRPLPRGTVITAADIQLVERELSAARNGHFTHINNVLDMVVKRNLPQDALLTPAAVKPARLIKRGNKVIILASTAGFSVRMKGEALMDGSQGQMIRVKNLRSKRTVQAEVVSRGTVKVKL